MKRRWSNNGGFQTLRMLEDVASGEVTSSSGGALAALSPASLGSPETYAELDLWVYEEAGLHPGSGVQGCGAVAALPSIATQVPLGLPAMDLPHTPRSDSAGSISSGKRGANIFINKLTGNRHATY